MKRRLLLLNVLLLALIVLAAWHLREQWLGENAHEQAVLKQVPSPIPAPPVTPVPAPKPLMGANYGDIAQKDLFAKDRNPIVIIEAPKVEPPKPMPPLPLFYGVMNLPSGPIAIMSEKANTRHVGVHAGDKMGEFKVLALNAQQVEFEWDGKKITKSVNELIDRSAPNTTAPPVPNAPAPATTAPQQAGTPSPLPPQPAPSAIPADAVPTDDGSYRAKDKDGRQWLYRQTPFGVSRVEDKGAAPAPKR